MNDSDLPPASEQPMTSALSKARSLLPLLLAGLFMVVGILALAWLGRDRDQLTGQRFTDIDLYPLVGDNRDRPLKRADLEGDIVLLYFWGTWCEPCRREYPSFVELKERFEGTGKGVKFISITCSSGEEYDKAQLEEDTLAFLKDFPKETNLYSDPAAYTRTNLAIAMPKGGFAYPTTILIDRNGLIRAVWRGRANMGQVANRIDQLLQEKAKPKSQQEIRK